MSMAVVQHANLVESSIALATCQPTFHQLFVVLALHQVTFVPHVILGSWQNRGKSGKASFAIMAASIVSDEKSGTLSYLGTSTTAAVTNEQSRFQRKAALFTVGALTAKTFHTTVSNGSTLARTTQTSSARGRGY